jgi:hypothetical protein
MLQLSAGFSCERKFLAYAGCTCLNFLNQNLTLEIYMFQKQATVKQMSFNQDNSAAVKSKRKPFLAQAQTKFVNISLLAAALIVGISNSAIASAKLEFEEQQDLVTRIDNGDGVEGIGDREIFTSVLVDSNDVQQGTKTADCLFDRVTPNGDVIVVCTEMIFLSGGTLFVQGEINLTGRFFKLQPEKLDLISGTGAYADAKGKETITRLRVEPGLYSVELVIN